MINVKHSAAKAVKYTRSINQTINKTSFQLTKISLKYVFAILKRLV